MAKIPDATAQLIAITLALRNGRLPLGHVYEVRPIFGFNKRAGSMTLGGSFRERKDLVAP